MHSHLHRTIALLAVALLALALTLVLSSGVVARAMLQASPLNSPLTPSRTPTAALIPGATIAAPVISTGEPLLPTLEPSPTFGPFVTLEPPTSVPLPLLAEATPTVSGFLPAPTIVNPNDLGSLPLARPATTGGGAASIAATPFPTADPGTTTVRAAVALLNYIWLVCGSVLLIGGAVAIILLWRRSGRN